ncbi:MAG TPA: 23S rRNA (pseudouridine(1915)-N(3))-methyltransferase RlmH, partial [Flavobacteriaceae bacterium]|nr:23S rRNA (pseudouridine(1915)-N(3))-methyltransferase RlmH [Flavobacteriaceae bacterium]
MNDYVKRVQYYTPFSIDYISDAKTGKKADPNLIKKEETKKIISKINKDDLVILLDEKGKSFSSE